MKRKIIFGILFLFGIAENGYSGNKSLLICGINSSSLIHAKSESQLGLTFGIGGEGNVPKKLDIALEFLYSKRNMFLRNITIAPMLWEQRHNYSFDRMNAKISIIFADIPLSLKYNLIVNRKMKCQFLIGPVFSMAFRDLCRKEYLSDEEVDGIFPQQYVPDYIRPENLETSFFWNNSGLGFRVGTVVYYHHLFIELIYQQSFHTVGNMDWILAEKRIQVLTLSSGVSL